MMQNKKKKDKKKSTENILLLDESQLSKIFSLKCWAFRVSLFKIGKRKKGSPDTPCYFATTMEVFPSFMTPTTMQIVYPRHSEVPIPDKPRSMEKEPKGAQLTIFYAGQVVVFDDFPADKVQEIISLALASKGISQSHNSSEYAHTYNQQGNNHPSSIPTIIPQAPSTPIVNDMPMAKKASLHRFLKKRKDRIAARTPYQTNSPSSSPNKLAESLGAKSTHI